MKYKCYQQTFLIGCCEAAIASGAGGSTCRIAEFEKDQREVYSPNGIKQNTKRPSSKSTASAPPRFSA